MASPRHAPPCRNISTISSRPSLPPTPASFAPGTPFIDDYIRSPEPIYDHLTRFSGLLPGDLDPAISAHHLTTLKQAYLKLRYLVDAGCVFVGHGLKSDFRTINMLVPPHQVRSGLPVFRVNYYADPAPNVQQ